MIIEGQNGGLYKFEVEILKDGLRIGISTLVIVRLSGNKNVKTKNIFKLRFQIKYWIFIIVCEYAALFFKRNTG